MLKIKFPASVFFNRRLRKNRKYRVIMNESETKPQAVSASGECDHESLIHDIMKSSENDKC